MKKVALFIDRDGVINHMVMQNNGEFDSPQNIDQVKLVDDVADVILLMNKMDIPVIEISNQPGVAKGKMDWKLLNDIEDKIHFLLNEQGTHITKAYRCFHHPNSILPELKVICDCRKPETGLLLQASKEYNIDLDNSVILGDSATDVEAGKKVGCITILFSHTNDLPEKIAANKKCQPDFKVYSHKEVIPVLQKLFI